MSRNSYLVSQFTGSLVHRLPGSPVIRFPGYPVTRVYKKSPKGTTLIELLVVTVIISVVALAVYATLNNGLKIWQRVNQRLPEEDLDIFFDKFAIDLRNIFKFTGIDFLGKDDRLQFVALVNSPGLQTITVGELIYSYNNDSEVLNREQRDFSQIYTQKTGAMRQVLSNIKSFKFRYYVYDIQKKEYLWQEESPKEYLPLAVRIELELLHGNKTKKITRTVGIPVSG